MSKLRLIPYAVLTAGSMVAGGGAYAQSMYDINQRQDYQQNQIERGVRDGQITRSEQHRLEQGERQIDRAQARAMADGHVTPQERARIDRMTDRESREIYRDSHNSQQSWDRGQQWGRTDGNAHNGWRDHDGSGRNGWDRGREGSRDADRRDWGRDRDRGSDHRDADRRDWGRDHNNGSWNQGRDHNGWNGQNNGQGNGWNHGGSNGTANNGSHNWGNGWNHGGSTGTGLGAASCVSVQLSESTSQSPSWKIFACITRMSLPCPGVSS